NALKEKDAYSDEDARMFMDKIVQVTFNLPKFMTEDFEEYLKKKEMDFKEELFPHLPAIIVSVKNNPRRLKRFLNNLSLMDAIHKNKKTEINYADLLILQIIEFENLDLWNQIKDTPETLILLKGIIKDISIQKDDRKVWEIPPEKVEQVPQKSLHNYLRNKRITDNIRSLSITTIDQIRQVISISGIVETPEIKAEVGKDSDERDIKYKFDEMIEVPAGVFQYGDEKKPVNIEKPFEIDAYPVTNSQFEEFIRAGGYENNDYWGEEGQKWRQDNSITLPRFWNDEKWNKPDHPVVGVSFYEADAYAKWAGKELPKEEQWERAARGTDGREYPWEGGFDKEKCNTLDSGIGKTTRVTRYPNGISPVGCYDMAGNVWEWTDSWYDEKRYAKVLRGGSWNDDLEFARCAARLRDNPGSWDIIVGFRCLRTKE
ncbi:MAG: SUMF1/EgtB/PvdO family nonheme iron enzyme, partial [Thermodesulfobacteriota bacterium]|nr:SUMF1/EgtB/PvdO family nonheme iron enzyme [Thermodesulfobacteriota bacterium]